MTTLNQTTMLLALVIAFAQGAISPAQAQSAEANGTVAANGTAMLMPASAPQLPMAQAFDVALQDYERGHWLRAFEQLVQLAERDHADAARMAMQMHGYGPTLYGQSLELQPAQVARFAWTRLRAQTALATNAR